jgi:hypothetical protein
VFRRCFFRGSSRFVVAGFLGLVMLSPADITACGDKFIVPSRGMRFGPPVNRESARILLYATPGSALSATLASLSVELTLRKAGYRPTSVNSAAQFEAALSEGGWDVIVVDLADGPIMASRFAVGGAPIVLPVAYSPARDTLEDARKRYTQVLNSPKKNVAFVEAIDKAIVARAKARAKTVTKSSD